MVYKFLHHDERIDMQDAERKTKIYCVAILSAIEMYPSLRDLFHKALCERADALRKKIGAKKLERCILFHRCSRSTVRLDESNVWDLDGEDSFQKFLEDFLKKHNPESLEFLKKQFSQ